MTESPANTECASSRAPGSAAQPTSPLASAAAAAARWFAVARLRKDHPDLCLIALTGDPNRELHEAVTEAGCDAVLFKGDLVDTLVERLSAAKSALRSG